MQKLSNYLKKRFITGIFVILPIGITLWILVKIFNMLDSILGTILYNVIGMKIPGLGLIITLLFVFEIGVIANNIFGKKITNLIEKIFEQLPIVKTIYGPVKDIMGNFSNKQSNNFKKAVFVTYPLEGSNSIGFITKENVIVNGENKTAVFIPTTPNPTSGFLVYLSSDKYVEIDIPVDVALKTIISLGSISPDVIEEKV